MNPFGSHLLNVITYLPLVVLLHDGALSWCRGAHSNPYAFAAGIALGMMIVAGHMQPYIHTAFLLALFTLFRVQQREVPCRTGLLVLATVGLM